MESSKSSPSKSSSPRRGDGRARKSGATNQGEGNRESDRRYRQRTEEFVNSPRGQDAAKHAGDVSDRERKEIERAEEKAKRRAHEHDPEEKKDFGKKS